MDELQTLLSVERDTRWVQANSKTIKEKYGDMFIAIKNEKIIESDENAEILIKKLENKGEDPALILIEFVNKKGIKLIL